MDSITVNGNNEISGLTGFVNKDTNIIVVVSKIVKGSINVVVKDTNGTIVVPSVSATGVEGTKDTLKAPVIQQGYKVYLLLITMKLLKVCQINLLDKLKT